MEERNNLISLVKEALEQGRAEEALNLLQNSKLNEDKEALFLKGEVYYHLQKWGESMNCFRNYLSSHPEDQRANSYIEMIQSILAFYHTDQFNP
jgi:tetratricopeptide (TPR) repeat protein